MLNRLLYGGEVLKATLNKYTIAIGISIGLLLIIGIFGVPFLYNEYVSATPVYMLPFTDENGDRLLITNNRSATDPTFDQLLAFLRQDDTNTLAILTKKSGPGPTDVRLHDNAEKSGIRAGVVELELSNETHIYSLNVFNTVDKGQILVDPMGTPVLACPLTIVHIENNDLDNNDYNTMVFIPIQNQSAAYLSEIGNVSGVGGLTTIQAKIIDYTW